MGNCAPKPKKATSEVVPRGPLPPRPIVKLYGPAASPTTSRIRVALLYKTVAIQFCPSSSEEEEEEEQENPVLKCGSDTVAGSTEAILRYIDGKLPGPPILPALGGSSSSAMPGIAMAATLQHRSIERHVERLVLWAEDLVARGGRGCPGGGGNAAATEEEEAEAETWRRGSPRMEVRRFGRSYSQLVEVMLEHAQMEERLIFPVLERADRGSCKVANEEHARDLPIMNGIKEDIKSVVVVEPGSPIYEEALLNLYLRLNTLLEHCREHFGEEERELLPLLEAAERSGGEREEELPVLTEQLMEVMEVTHSHLFDYLMAGLRPHEAMQYLDLVCRCRDRRRVAGMLRSLAARMELAPSVDHAMML